MPKKSENTSPSQPPAKRSRRLGRRSPTDQFQTPELDSLASGQKSQAGRTNKDLRRVAVDELTPSPDNPRKVALTAELVRTNPDEIKDPTTAELVSGVQELAKSISTNGDPSQPIVAYPAGNGYEILMGERRYWALVYLGHKETTVLLHSSKPDDSAVQALAENVQRVDLNPAEKFSGIKAAVRQKITTGVIEGMPTTIDDLAELIGVPRHIARSYKPVLDPDAPSDFVAALESGLIPSDRALRDISELRGEFLSSFIAELFKRGEYSPAMRQKHLNRQKAAEKGQSKPPAKKPACKPVIKNLSAVEAVFEKVGYTPSEAIDFNDPTQVQQAIVAFFNEFAS